MMGYRVFGIPTLSVLCLSAFCLWGNSAADAMDVSDKGDPALSVSSTPPLPSGVATNGDPALSVSSDPAHTVAKGDPALSVSSNPARAATQGDPALSVSSAPALDPAACRLLTKHRPDANVTYQPGIDAQGKPVAPADISGGKPIQLPKTLTIPLTVQLAKIINLDTTKYPYNQLGEGTEAQIGMLTVTGDHVLFNGQPLSDEQQGNLAVLCMSRNK